MSLCMLIAADKPLPLCNRQTVRTRTVDVDGEIISISLACGFSVEEHIYYRDCVNDMGYSIKPYRYELDICEDETDLQNLKDYLNENFAAGEVAELWGIWVSSHVESHPVCRETTCRELTVDDITTLCNAHIEDCWLSVIF